MEGKWAFASDVEVKQQNFCPDQKKTHKITLLADMQNIPKIQYTCKCIKCAYSDDNNYTKG